MIEIYKSLDSATVGLLQNRLEAAGIRTYFKNEFASNTTVTIPSVAPTLCIVEEADLEQGIDLIRDYLEAPEAPASGELVCAKCGETSPGTFSACWNCEAPLPS